MKTMGILGGMSWKSTSYYYELMNKEVFKRLGGLNSIDAIIYSVNFAEVALLVEKDNWDAVVVLITNLAKKIESAGADFLMMTANAIHRIADRVEASISIPLIHIVDPVGGAILKSRLKKVALLGTKITMKQPFYKERLAKEFGIETIIPEEKEQDQIHQIIFDELAKGVLNEKSKEECLSILQSLIQKGAEGVIFGCTEIHLLLHPSDVNVPVFDSTELHALAAVDFALK